MPHEELGKGVSWRSLPIKTEVKVCVDLLLVERTCFHSLTTLDPSRTGVTRFFTLPNWRNRTSRNSPEEFFSSFLSFHLITVRGLDLFSACPESQLDCVAPACSSRSWGHPSVKVVGETGEAHRLSLSLQQRPHNSHKLETLWFGPLIKRRLSVKVRMQCGMLVVIEAFKGKILSYFLFFFLGGDFSSAAIDWILLWWTWRSAVSQTHLRLSLDGIKWSERVRERRGSPLIGLLWEEWIHLN